MTNGKMWLVSACAAACMWSAAWGQPAPTAPTDWQKLDDAAFVAWVNDKTEWQGRTTYEQVQIAGRLNRLGDSGQAARGKVKQYVMTAHFADEGKVNKLGVERANQFAGVMSAELSAGEKSAWAQRVRGAFTADAAKLEKLSMRDVGQVIAALEKLDDGNADGVWSAWVTQTNQPASLNPTDLSVAAQKVAALGADGRTARQKLVTHLDTVRIKDLESTKTFGLSGVDHVIPPLLADIAPAKRVEWVLRIKKAFADGQGRTVGPLKALEDRLALMADVDAAGRAAAGQYVAGQMADKATAQSAGPELCLLLVRGVADNLPAQAKGQLAGSLKAAFVSDDEALAELEMLDVQNVESALKLLDDQAPGTTWATWLEKSNNWQSMTTAQLSSLAGRLRAQGPAAEIARKKMITYLTGAYMADPKKVEQVGMPAWSVFVVKLVEDMNAATKLLWASKLEEAFGDATGPTAGAIRSKLVHALGILRQPAT